jgi:hypothetical protein
LTILVTTPPLSLLRDLGEIAHAAQHTIARERATPASGLDVGVAPRAGVPVVGEARRATTCLDGFPCPPLDVHVEPPFEKSAERGSRDLARARLRAAAAVSPRPV